MATMSDQLLEQISRDLQDFHRYLKQDNDQLQKMPPIISGFQKAAIAASVAVTGIVAGAGGAAWSTFTGSVQLVGMQLARFFIPALIAASVVAQDFAEWLEDLTPEARDVVVGFAKLAAGAAAVYLAVTVLANPMVWLGAAVLAAVVALKMLPDIIHFVDEQLRKKFGIGATDFITGFFTLWTAHPKVQAALGAVPGAAAVAGLPLQSDLVKNFTTMLQESMKKNLGFNLEDITNLIGGGPTAAKTPRPPRPFLFDFVKEMQPRFSSVEEARKQFQIGALKSPLEQETLKYQRQMAQDFVQMVPKIKQFLEKGLMPGGLG